MIRALLVLLAAAALLAAAFAVLAPASLVAHRLEKATGGALVARDVEGTIWRGRGVLAGGSTQLPIAWSIDAAPLLRGVVRARVAPFNGDSTAPPRGEIFAQRDHLELRATELTLPAAMVFQPTQLARTGLLPDGDITLVTPRLDWTPASIQGDARIVWRAARLTLPPFPAVELGEVTAILATAGERLSGPVTNTGGVLDIRGNVSVGADRSADVSLTLTPRNPNDTVLTRMLAGVGKPDGSGWRVAWRWPAR